MLKHWALRHLYQYAVRAADRLLRFDLYTQGVVLFGDARDAVARMDLVENRESFRTQSWIEVEWVLASAPFWAIVHVAGTLNKQSLHVDSCCLTQRSESGFYISSSRT